ncbi:MAG: MG2 domain-containing protein [Planctomycetota bacterium]|nr:MG2 domain-containing protein [Planctomycetota bacterium]
MKCRMRFLAVLGAALVAGAVLWHGRLAHADKATTQGLGGPDRYLTAVSTDKPMYKPGEKVYVRGVILNAVSRKPLPDNQQSAATIEVKGPKGDTVASGNTQTQDSVWGFGWEIPKDMAGGEYTVKVTYPWTGHAPAERKFDIRAYRAPRLRSQIVFLRDGYGPGEKVTATLHTERSEGGIPEGAKVTAIARVDGTEIRGADGKVDPKGNCMVAFDLPKEIARGEGTLALVIEDGGTVETASKTIPILLQTIDIKFYPEGGDLIAGLPNRVYFEARQPNGKPADLEGEIDCNTGRGGPMEATKARTDHEGRGRFVFTPVKEREGYFLRVTQPAGIKKTFSLPDVKMPGAIIRTAKETFAAGDPIAIQVGHINSAPLKVTLAQREVEIAAKEIALEVREKALVMTAVELDPKDASGVLRVTVWDDKGVPLAERLIYREPAKKVNVSVMPDKQFFVPGDNVKLTVKTTDNEGKPVPAVVGLTATDDSILEMIEKREQAPRLPVMVLLEPEVKDLADAHVYLDDKNPKAPLAVDLLLGTQGWRRFAFMDAEKFIAENGDNARRVLALKIQARHEVEKAALMLRDGAKFEGAARGMAVPMAAGAPPPVAAAPAPQNRPQPQIGAPREDKAVADAKAPAAPPAPPAVERQLKAKDAEEPMPVERPKLQAAMEAAEQKADRRAVFAGKAMKRLERQDFVVVREFAHQVRPNRKPTDRVDFAETLYWNAGVKTNAQGEATVSFGLNDSVTTFRVFADAFGGDGALGAANIGIESVQPFYVEPKLPLEVTSGDTILLPVSVANSLGSDLPGATVAAEMKGEFKIASLPPFDVKALDRTRQILKIDVGFNNALEDFVLTAAAGPYLDKVTRKLSVKPKGFPIEVPFGGMLGPAKAATHALTIPEGIVPRSLTTNVAVYPTPLANMTEALQRMIQDPNGCFEQTSSTSYPLTMAQQYFLSHTGVDPQLVERARQKLDAGYKRLVGFWCPDRGYEWFGQNPGHEALTAFGVLHFADMAQVREVDQNMITSTRAWLLKQRDGKGGFERKRRALHTWIEDKDCSNAYIIWALLESGEKPDSLSAELASLKTAAAQSQNSYVVALAGNALHMAGDKAEAAKLMERLVAKQNKDGAVEGGTATIVGSGGEALTIETTSLAALAWLRDPNFAGAVEKTMKFLADSCKAGRYGSTQSTVLALRAIVTYDKQRARPKAPGKVQVFVDGQGVGGWTPTRRSWKAARPRRTSR